MRRMGLLVRCACSCCTWALDFRYTGILFCEGVRCEALRDERDALEEPHAHVELVALLAEVLLLNGEELDGALRGDRRVRALVRAEGREDELGEAWMGSSFVLRMLRTPEF